MIRPGRTPHPAEVGLHYDEIDLFYRDLWGEHLHHGLWLTGREDQWRAVEQLLERVSATAEIGPGNRVCDVGCGYGGTGRFLAERYGCSVTGYTISKRQHEYAKEAGSPGRLCIFKLGDWLAAEEEPGSFDVILAIESTEHMEDRAGIFRTAARLLKPGGRLVVCAWAAAEDARAWEVRHLLRPICREGQLTGLGTETEYRAWFDGAGFTDTQVTDLSSQVSRTWRIIAVRVLRELLRKRAWRYLADRHNRNRRFLVSVLRIPLAYRTGAFRYLLLAARLPGPTPGL